MNQITLRSKIRQLSIGYKILRKIARNKKAQEFWGKNTMNYFVITLNEKAKKISPKLAYYFISETIL